MNIDRRTLALGLAFSGIASTAHAHLDAAAFDRAFLYGFAPFEFARIAARAPTGRNALLHRRNLADANARDVTTPNNDTLYSSAFLDLEAGPVLLDLPDVTDRYVSWAFMDSFTDNFVILGSRASGGKGGRFLVAGPGWTGAAPEGRTVLRSPTQDVWFLGRVLIDGPDDLANARRIQDAIQLNPTQPKPPAAPVDPPGFAQDAARYVDVVNRMVARSDPASPNGRRAAMHAAAGIGPARTFSTLDPKMQETWRALIGASVERLKTAAPKLSLVRGAWTAPKANLGDYGDDDSYRAAIALTGLGALKPVEAMYFGTRVDGAGAMLDGRNRYALRLPVALPTTSFWSLTMYQIEQDGRLFFAPNPIGRYAIGDRTRGLVREDGAIRIVLQADRPEERDVANWLPAPNGPFHLVLRTYLPEAAILDGRWWPPAVTRL